MPTQSLERGQAPGGGRGFLGTFVGCRVLDCHLLGKIPVLFGCVRVRAEEGCTCVLHWMTLGLFSRALLERCSELLIASIPLSVLPLLLVSERGFSWLGSLCGGLFKPKRVTTSSLGILVWCGFSQFLAATHQGRTLASSRLGRNVLTCEYSRQGPFYWKSLRSQEASTAL